MKRYIALFLLAAILAGSVSCGSEGTTALTSGTEDTETTTAAETEANIYEKLRNIDLDGYEFNILTYDTSNWDAFIAPETETGDVLNDTAFKRNLEVENLLNVAITVQKEGIEKYETTFRNLVMSGDAESIDLIVLWSPGQRIKYITENLAYDWRKLPYVDLDAEYYNKTANEAYTVDGKQYFAVSDFTYAIQQHWRILFSKRLAADFSVSSPYDAVFDGTWTFDRLVSDIKNVTVDLNSNGKADLEDRFGLIANPHTTAAFMFGFGESPVMFGDNGAEFSLNTESFTDKITKLVGLCDNPDVFINKNGNDQYQNFYAGNSLYMPYSSDPALLREIDVDFGYLPYPKWDEAQENYVVWAAGGMMALPSTLNNPERSGAVVEALSIASGKYLKDAFVEKYIEGKVLRDDESVKVYRMMRENMTYEVSYNLDPSGKLTDLAYYRYFITNKSTDTASYWAKNSEKIINSYSDFLESVGQD